MKTTVFAEVLSRLESRLDAVTVRFFSMPHFALILWFIHMIDNQGGFLPHVSLAFSMQCYFYATPRLKVGYRLETYIKVVVLTSKC